MDTFGGLHVCHCLPSFDLTPTELTVPQVARTRSPKIAQASLRLIPAPLAHHRAEKRDSHPIMFSSTEYLADVTMASLLKHFNSTSYSVDVSTVALEK